MIQSGLKPIQKDKRDFDFHRTFGTKAGGIFPDALNVDAGLTMPNQDLPNPQFMPEIPALPFGCTDYTSSELCIDEDKKLYNPIDLDNVTHANADNGCDIRVSLGAALTVYNREAYFAVTQVQGSDWFDSIRAAIYASNRPVSIGTPWMDEWRTPVSGVNPIGFTYTGSEPWHNWKIPGWNANTQLIGKTWQGTTYGDNGWGYWTRETINEVMEIPGTGAFTIAPILNATVQTVLIGDYEKVVADLEQML